MWLGKGAAIKHEQMCLLQGLIKSWVLWLKLVQLTLQRQRQPRGKGHKIKASLRLPKTLAQIKQKAAFNPSTQEAEVGGFL